MRPKGARTIPLFSDPGQGLFVESLDLDVPRVAIEHAREHQAGPLEVSSFHRSDATIENPAVTGADRIRRFAVRERLLLLP